MLDARCWSAVDYPALSIVHQISRLRHPASSICYPASSIEEVGRMSEHHWSWTVDTSFPSRPGAHLPCMRNIVQQLVQLGWGDHDLFSIELALAESLTNAIRHGNQLDESKQVVVSCKVSPQRFWLRVQDEGKGFQPHNVPDCTADENLECLGGRGVALIKAYMTSVEYNDCGNCVTMEKVRGQVTGEG
jgi:serine/threonine-protein kinase RsbW